MTGLAAAADRWLTTAEAATYTGRHPKTVAIAANAKELLGSRAGSRGHWRFRTYDLDAWVRGEKPAATPSVPRVTAAA